MRCKYCNKKCVRNFNYCSDWCKEQKNTERKKWYRDSDHSMKTSIAHI